MYSGFITNPKNKAKKYILNFISTDDVHKNVWIRNTFIRIVLNKFILVLTHSYLLFYNHLFEFQKLYQNDNRYNIKCKNYVPCWVKKFQPWQSYVVQCSLIFSIEKSQIHSSSHMCHDKFQFTLYYTMQSTTGSVHRKVNLKNGRNGVVFDRLWYPLSILLLVAIGAKLIGPHRGLQVDKQKVCQVTGSVNNPTAA